MESNHVIWHAGSTDLTVDDMDGIPPGPESLQQESLSRMGRSVKRSWPAWNLILTLYNILTVYPTINIARRWLCTSKRRVKFVISLTSPQPYSKQDVDMKKKQPVRLTTLSTRTVNTLPQAGDIFSSRSYPVIKSDSGVNHHE